MDEEPHVGLVGVRNPGAQVDGVVAVAQRTPYR